MVTAIKDQMREARKKHPDDSAYFIIEAMDWIRHGSLPYDYVGKHERLTFTELRAIAQLKANNWMIMPGQAYIKQWNKMDGEHYTFKTLPHIYKICVKYKLYGDD